MQPRDPAAVPQLKYNFQGITYVLTRTTYSFIENKVYILSLSVCSFSEEDIGVWIRDT